MYFEGRALKHQVTIYPKIEKYIVSKSTTKNEWNYQISGAFGAPKNLPKHTQIEGEKQAICKCSQRSDKGAPAEGGRALGLQIRDSDPQSTGRAGTPYTRF